MSTFIESADSRETDIVIMNAIYEIADNNDEIADRIWGEPTKSEIERVVRIVSEHGETTEFCWGAAGSNWV